MYRIDLTAELTHNEATLHALATGSVVGFPGEGADVFAQYQGEGRWTVAWPDNAYESGRRVQRHVPTYQLPCGKVFLAVAE